MELNAFASLAVLQLPSQSRLLASACCPDKDLVILISRLGGKDRMSLWKMQGSKKWEVDVGTEETSAEEIVGIAWSPDGQSVAVAHDPPRITLHSIQDGQEERVLPAETPSNTLRRPYRITGLWWFQEEHEVTTSSIPDMFRRNNAITGTAHSILKTLPLLDYLHEDGQKLTATDIFAFQGSQTRSGSKSSQPELIRSWPALLRDRLAASISSHTQEESQRSVPSHQGDGAGNANMNSILAIVDDLGHVRCFLDGTYPLGAISLNPETSTPALFKYPKNPVFLAHCQRLIDNTVTTDLYPTVIELPLLRTRKPRDLAKLSSTTRELIWYTIRVVKEMRVVWFGSDTSGGARELGPKWIQALETKQKDQFGQEDPNGMLDLTSLLVTGRVSDCLADFLGSGEQMSERGIQKWESTVTDALVKLRDYSEKRVAPACQRLLLILDEILGWAQLPQFAQFELVKDDIKTCLDLAGRAIMISGWLAAVARRELSHFKEFISFIRHETVVVNPATETRPVPEYDMLEVNHYLMSGLVVSSIDKWFMGPISQLSPEDLGVPGDKQDLQSVLRRAQAVASDPLQIAWQANITQKDLSHLDRNLDALIQDLAARCQRIFVRAASASARSAVVSRVPKPAQEVDTRSNSRYLKSSIVRDRITEDKNEIGNFWQYLAVHVTSTDQPLFCLSRMRYGSDMSAGPLVVDVALLECRVWQSNSDQEECLCDMDILSAEFFDDESMVLLYRYPKNDGQTIIAMFGYNDLGYQTLSLDGYGNGPSREDLVQQVLQLWNEGHITSGNIPIKSCRELIAGNDGDVSLAVNGRIGRRVACVLDIKGSTMEILDMEGNSEEMEADENAELEAEKGT